MKVWISRSQPGADRQADDLRRSGHQVVVAPVIDIEPLRPALPDAACDQVIFLSEHAVRLGLPSLIRLRWFASAGVVAVGARTATVLEAVLQARQVSVAAPAVATSEGLLALAQFVAPRGRSILLVAGAEGRSLLEQQLTARGARVQRYPCYRRVIVSALDPAVLDCDVIVAASGDGLRQVAKLWLGAAGRADVPVLVPSARVAGLGVEVGFCNLHDCGGADSDAWLRGLAQVQSAGTS